MFCFNCVLLSCSCKCIVSLHLGAKRLSVICNCGMLWQYIFTCLMLFYVAILRFALHGCLKRFLRTCI